MSMSKEVHETLRQAFIHEVTHSKDPGYIDFWLDKYNDYMLLATHHDAVLWGFSPENWMIEERIKLAERGGCNWPKEVI